MVAHTLEWNRTEAGRSVWVTLSIFFTAILLHQSNVIFGVNLSFADFFSIFILVFLIWNKRLLVPMTPLVFFIAISFMVLVTAAFYIPIKFMHEPAPARIVSDYIKLLAIFFYFIIGYNLSQINYLKETIRWYSYFGMLIGIVGVWLTFLNIPLFTDILYFAETRFRGLMIDPNYFSVLQITAMVYFTRMESIKTRYKLLAAILTLLSVLVSGSKTGIITLLSYSLIRLVEYLFLKQKKLNVLVFQVFFIVVLALLAPWAMLLLETIFSGIAAKIPSFGRVYYLLTDFGSAVSEGGSGREATWKAALQVIQLSPLIGVGIGTYTSLAWQMFHYDNVAHNTFLQLTAEWGIPLAVLFFIYVFFILGKATQSKMNNEINLILRDMIIILLIGSLAISLNNARVLWLFLGAIVFSLKDKNAVTK
ncbi:hypothetical protein WQ57_18420 [Mesobacillus campisalis]|uniref:O-antigen ligase-related domain-containing protein n=1 Tax=Mesobacillus campisalis TaxID=1408103 RepID=A0A0M2SR17_9BACI|nr:O-antigen ligase family protein [Mesobacillus campisalis]KKK36623.1 hypothetical protein WQ57_18420 [Mesobacillus campisalis]